MLWPSWREGIQAGSTGAGCGCPDDIQWQALMFKLSFKIQRNFFSLDWAPGLRFPPVSGKLYLLV